MDGLRRFNQLLGVLVLELARAGQRAVAAKENQRPRPLSWSASPAGSASRNCRPVRLKSITSREAQADVFLFTERAICNDHFTSGRRVVAEWTRSLEESNVKPDSQRPPGRIRPHLRPPNRKRGSKPRSATFERPNAPRYFQEQASSIAERAELERALDYVRGGAHSVEQATFRGPHFLRRGPFPLAYELPA